jgi:mRNA-degrading endonuclease RelE of RelBE toxin-antitoxin system
LPEPLLTRIAHEDLRNLPDPIRRAVIQKTDRIGLSPETEGVPLLGRLRRIWSARVGAYSIVYAIDEIGGNPRVVMRAVRHRAVAYGRRRRRH